MTERSYVECTGSAIAALAAFRAAHPRPSTDPSAARSTPASRFLRGAQRPDGACPGFWGINFTYAAFHAVRGASRRRASGPTTPGSPRAADWLVRVQRADGGWGEHYSGCVTDRYVEHPESQAVMTAGRSSP